MLVFSFKKNFVSIKFKLILAFSYYVCVSVYTFKSCILRMQLYQKTQLTLSNSLYMHVSIV